LHFTGRESLVPWHRPPNPLGSVTLGGIIGWGPMPRLIVLLSGAVGTGKTTLANKLSGRFGLEDLRTRGLITRAYPRAPSTRSAMQRCSMTRRVPNLKWSSASEVAARCGRPACGRWSRPIASRSTWPAQELSTDRVKRGSARARDSSARGPLPPTLPPSEFAPVSPRSAASANSIPRCSAHSCKAWRSPRS